ncbi:MAG: hypothetical protein WC748_07150 [Legionellales bacterium]|jgi:hypothetical protein
MNEVPAPIERIFSQVVELTSNHLVGNEGVQRIIKLAPPPRSRKDALEILKQEHKNFDDPRVYISQAWFALAFFIYKEISAYENPKGIHSFIIPLMQSLLLAGVLLYINAIIGPLPGPKILNKLILPQREFEKHQRELAFKQARMNTHRKGPLSPWRIFSSNKELEAVFDSHKIPVLLHESIILALEGLNAKCKGFDCICTCALLLLKLIESKTQHTIKWLYKPGTGIDGQNIILLNHTAGGIQNFEQWNDDCIMLDGWHGICKTADQIKEAGNFFSRYPLLSPEDKVVLATIDPSQHANFDYYIKEMNKAIDRSNYQMKMI